MSVALESGIEEVTYSQMTWKGALVLAATAVVAQTVALLATTTRWILV